MRKLARGQILSQKEKEFIHSLLAHGEATIRVQGNVETATYLRKHIDCSVRVQVLA